MLETTVGSLPLTEVMLNVWSSERGRDRYCFVLTEERRHFLWENTIIQGKCRNVYFCNSQHILLLCMEFLAITYYILFTRGGFYLLQ